MPALLELKVGAATPFILKSIKLLVAPFKDICLPLTLNGVVMLTVVPLSVILLPVKAPAPLNLGTLFAVPVPIVVVTISLQARKDPADFVLNAALVVFAVKPKASKVPQFCPSLAPTLLPPRCCMFKIEYH